MLKELKNTLICKLRYMALVGFDIYSILLLLLSQKYVIYINKTTSPFPLFMNKRISLFTNSL
jgi:hypothetical protein